MNSKITFIRAKNKSLGEGLHEFWEYRELLYSKFQSSEVQ